MPSLRDWQTLDGTPCSIQICWNISAGERSSFAHNALLLQCFVQYQRRVNVMQGEFCAFLQRELHWNHLVHFPASTGTVEFQHASFTVKALNRKVNQVCLKTWHYIAIITGGHQLFLGRRALPVAPGLLSSPMELEFNDRCGRCGCTWGLVGIGHCQRFSLCMNIGNAWGRAG